MPPLTVVVLLYRVLVNLQITVLRPETLLRVGMTMALGMAAGLLAGFGGEKLGHVVLSLVAQLLLVLPARRPGVQHRRAALDQPHPDGGRG